MNSKTFLALAILSISTWTIASSDFDAECKSWSYFATSSIETELGGGTSCKSTWGFPQLFLHPDSKIKAFKLESSAEQKLNIVSFKEMLLKLNDSKSADVIKKIDNIEYCINKEKIEFKEYDQALIQFVTEIDQLIAENKITAKAFFN